MGKKNFRKKLESRVNKVYDSVEGEVEELLNQLNSPDLPGYDTTKEKMSRLHPEEKITLMDDAWEKINLSYFIDGTVKTLKVGGVEGSDNLYYPISLSQVVAAAVSCMDGNKFCKNTAIEKLYILLPNIFQLGFEKEEIYSMCGYDWFVDDPLSGKTVEKKEVDVADFMALRRKSITRARWLMRQSERELVTSIFKQDRNKWIVRDGTLFDISIQTAAERDMSNIIGLSKTFTLNPWVEIDGKREQIGYIQKLVRNLKIGYRSPVYKLIPEEGREEKYTYMWFLRLHPSRFSPFDGVLKVEIPPHVIYKDEKYRVNTINGISHAIWNWRMPYDCDIRRNVTFLYPIRVAENAAKSLTFSIEKMNGIWMAEKSGS